MRTESAPMASAIAAFSLVAAALASLPSSLAASSSPQAHGAGRARSAERTRATADAEAVAAAAPAWAATTGVKSLLLIRVVFPDAPQEPSSETDAREMLDRVNAFFMDNSYGALSIASALTPVLTLPRAARSYEVPDDEHRRALLTDARAVAAGAGYRSADYDLDCVQFLLPRHRPWANIGSKGVWLPTNSPGSLCHELGHNLGLRHANAWLTTDGSVTGSGSNREYEDPYDTMGKGDLQPFNTCYKHQLGWLPDWAVTDIATGGVYQVHPQDVASLLPGLGYALRIPADAQRDYWIEARRGSSDLFVRWGPRGGSEGGTELLDLTPGTEGARYDAALKVGQIVRDAQLGLAIESLGPSPSAPEAIDVHVSFDAESTLASDAIHVTVQRDSGGAMTLILAGEPGRNCVVEASTNLVHWEAIATATLEDRPVRVTDGAAAAGPARFYRVVPE